LITTEALARRADHPAAICARGEGYRAAAIEVDLGRRGVPMQALKTSDGPFLVVREELGFSQFELGG
jgi:hypothetical protein